MSHWWERIPGRLDAELQEFAARGLEFELDESLFRGAGRVLLRGNTEFDGESIALEVLYPDLFPYLRPEVYAPGLSLPRHQNPTHFNLCLLGGDTSAWNPEETGAWLVTERVPELLSLFNEGPDAMAKAEVAQGEPVSAYFQGVSGTMVLVPAEALSLGDKLRVGSGRLYFATDSPPNAAVRALLGELVVRGHNRKVKRVARADDALLHRFGGQQLQMRWARLDSPPSGLDADGLFAAAEEAQPGFGQPPWQQVHGGEISVTGVVFQEEVRQGVYEDGWAFGIRLRRSSAGRLHETAYVVRGERLTPQDLGERIPKLAAFRDRQISLLGLGAIGAPLALELARNQIGELRLLEYDHVEAAQVVRWPFGIDAVGFAKLEVVASSIERGYPYTRVERFQHRLGQTALERSDRSEDEGNLLERFIRDSSIVIDATAELGIQQLVADFAAQLDLPQLYVSATEGARGGHVALVVPGQGGCWYCWKQHLLDGTLPLPPSEGDGTVQPRGCAAPTFTGAGFDLLPVTAQAVRMAVAALMPGSEYRSMVAVYAVPDDFIEPPNWELHHISVHEECPRCGAAH